MAREREEEQSLSAVGVSAAGARPARDRRYDARHVLVGVLAAEYGRVSRALQIAGIDVDGVRQRALEPS